MAQAKAKPSQAQANSPGLAWDFSRPEPPKARPKPWLSGQAKASTSLHAEWETSWVIRKCIIHSSRNDPWRADPWRAEIRDSTNRCENVPQ